MNRVLRITAGLLFGALLGAGLVLLFAPRGGVETRQLIQDRIQDILDEGRRTAEERRLELTFQLETLKQPVPKA
jgi:gas vesicle protein